jgi:hypothetical protein
MRLRQRCSANQVHFSRKAKANHKSRTKTDRGNGIATHGSKGLQPPEQRNGADTVSVTPSGLAIASGS